MIPQHLSTNVEHPTPKEIIEAARTVLGGIDLDPASSAAMNEHVRATRFIGLPDDGLAVGWSGRVFLNPPGGRAENKWARHYKTPSSAGAWWRKLVEEFLRKFGADARGDRRHEMSCELYSERWNGSTAYGKECTCAPNEESSVTQAIFVGFTLEILRTTQSKDPDQRRRWPSALSYPICVPRDRLCFSGSDPTHANVIVYLGPYVDRFEWTFSEIGQVRL